MGRDGMGWGGSEVEWDGTKGAEVEMIEVKQGPYFISKDKVKFDKTDESKIKIK